MSLSTIFKSGTVWSILLGLFGFISQPSVTSLLPEKWAALIAAIGAALTAFNIHANQVATATAHAAAIASVQAKVNQVSAQQVIGGGK